MVSVMTIGADGFVHRFSKTVNATDRLVLRQGVPRIEGQVVAKQVLLAAIEVLGREVNIRHCLEGRD